MSYLPVKQIKTFDNVTGDNVKELNLFLKSIGEKRIYNITPIYNTILGGVIYVVEYLE